jgi:WD40 repeat protein
VPISYQPIQNAILAANNWQLVSGSVDQTIRRWNLQTCECTQMTGHTGIVYSIAMSASIPKEIVFSGSFDESIKVWNLETEHCFLSMRSPRPYEGMQITKVKGLTQAQKLTLKALGAVEN